MTSKRHVMFGAIATLGLAAGCGSGVTTTTASDIPPEVSRDGGAATVFDAKFGQTYPIMPSSNPPRTATVAVDAPTSTKSRGYAPTPEHGWYVTFHVTFKATSENVQPGGEFAFEVRTADGQHYNLSAGYGDTLPNSILHNGEVASGTMTADLPAPHGTLTYSPAYEARPTQVEWPF